MYNASHICYMDAKEWTEEKQDYALQLQQKTGILSNAKTFGRIEGKYPTISSGSIGYLDFEMSTLKKKGRDRNKPCPCGSGKKYKKCCGR